MVSDFAQDLPIASPFYFWCPWQACKRLLQRWCSPLPMSLETWFRTRPLAVHLVPLKPRNSTSKMYRENQCLGQHTLLFSGVVGKQKVIIEAYLPLLVQFTFIAKQHLFNICWRIFLNVPYPIFDIFKRLFLCNIVDKHDAHGASVICRRNRSEAFLPSCVPASAHTRNKSSSFVI